MDFDLDLDCDEIQQFLREKLLEIKTENRELEKTLSKREEILENCKMKQENSLEIDNVWKRIYNNKLVIGINIKNEGNIRLDQTNVLLHWGSTCPLIYSIFLVSTKSVLVVSSLNTSGYILIVINATHFTDKLSYNISGYISYNYRQSLKIPLTEILFEDYYKMDEMQISRIVDGNLEDLFAVCLSGEIYGLTMKLPLTDYRQIDYLFENNCAFTRINVPNQNYFISNRISWSFDWAILEVQQMNNLFFIILFTKNFESALGLVKYMYKCLENIVVTPNCFDLKKAKIDDFKKSLFQECRLISEFSQTQNISKISDLTHLEYKNDLMYCKIKKEEIKYPYD